MLKRDADDVIVKKQNCIIMCIFSNIVNDSEKSRVLKIHAIDLYFEIFTPSQTDWYECITFTANVFKLLKIINTEKALDFINNTYVGAETVGDMILSDKVFLPYFISEKILNKSFFDWAKKHFSEGNARLAFYIADKCPGLTLSERKNYYLQSLSDENTQYKAGNALHQLSIDHPEIISPEEVETHLLKIINKKAGLIVYFNKISSEKNWQTKPLNALLLYLYCINFENPKFKNKDIRKMINDHIDRNYIYLRCVLTFLYHDKGETGKALEQYAIIINADPNAFKKMSDAGRQIGLNLMDIFDEKVASIDSEYRRTTHPKNAFR